MNKISKFLMTCIQIIFILMIFLMLVLNFQEISLEHFLFGLLTFGIIGIVIYILYKSKILSNKTAIWFFLGFVLIGSILRLVLIQGIDFKLESDFAFYFGNALGINGQGTINSDYLSYNGYAFIFANIIAILFKIFGTSVQVILHFNLVCQIATIFILYFLIKKKSNAVLACLLSSLWFFFPNNIFANLLVSTETLFMLIFIGTIAWFIKIIDNREITGKNIINYAVLGLLMSLCNNIRPVMLVFIVALLIYYILTSKKLKQYITLLTILIVYFVGNSLANIYVENAIDMQTRPGALEWSIYFGANKEYCGGWSPEDSEKTTEILKQPDGSKILLEESFERYVGYGLVGSYELLECKFESLWTDNYSMYYFILPLVENTSTIDLTNYNELIVIISNVLSLFFLLIAFVAVIYEMKKKKFDMVFIELFAIGYVLSNLVVCLNGRYNYPLYPLLIIISIPLLYNLFKKHEKITEQNVIKQSKNPKILLILPAYNEEGNIKNTVEKIKKCKNKYDFVIINDGSKDKTSEICLKEGYPHISLISNLGIGGAVQTGYKYALENNYDIAIQFDSDGQHDVEYVADLIKPMDDGYDFVIGSRFLDKKTSDFKSTASRRVGIKIISLLIKFFTGEIITDPTSGFRAANKNIIELFANNYPSEYPEPSSSIMVHKKGYTIKEIPAKMHERTAGKSSIHSWKNAYYMINVSISMFIASLRRYK